MPPEPQEPPQFWDRKELLKERRHDRFPPSPTTPPNSRWRDNSSHRDFNRWADFRRPPGHGKQGDWHQFTGESGHGYTSRSSSDKMSEDDSFRSRGAVKYGRNGRENRGSFSQREWKGHSWDAGNPGRQQKLHDVNGNNLRPVDDILISPNHPNPDFANTGDANGLGSGQRIEGESSLDWKPLKWTHSGSLSSRGSGLSHSSSSKSMGGGVDSHEGKAEMQPKSLTPLQSPFGDVVACATSAAPCEETTSRKKKPRLGWGEGLAKYEKKKVEPDPSLNKAVVAVNIVNGDAVNMSSLNISEKSPGVVAFSDCATPATPSSVACSSSPGVEEKSSGRAASVENDFSNLCSSPCNGPLNHFEGFDFNIEKLDMALVANLGSTLIELLQADKLSAADSSFVRSTAMNKLLIWKSDLAKDLEMTESEIDFLESELKRLKSVSGRRRPCPAASSSLPVETSVPCEEQQATFNLISRPAPLDVQSLRDDADVDVEPLCNGTLQEVHSDEKDEDVDSPGTATSKFVEPLSLVKAVFPSEVVNQVDCSGVLDATQHIDTEMKSVEPEPTGEDTTVSTSFGDSMMLMRRSDDAPAVSNVVSHTSGEDKLYNLILASNKELATQASEVFNKLLPRDQSKINVSGVFDVSFADNDSVIKQKVSMRKRFLRFKERVLTLKFRAFQHLWKEDMHLLSLRKYRSKYQKKCELSLRTVIGGYQKPRLSIRSRFCSPGTLSLVPTTEIVNFASKLLSDSEVRPFRDSVKMPTLILDKREKLASRFISSNGLVEDPFTVEKERTMVNPWTAVEKEIFLDKLAIFGKDFRKIASFLDHKTTADCVKFYYKNHKSECFEKTKKKQGKSSLNTYMVTSEKRWNRDINAASLDILGAASMMAAYAESGVGNRQVCASRMSIAVQGDPKPFMGNDGTTEKSSSDDIIRNENEAVAADVLAGICGSLSSEAMSSCITSSADPGEGYREWKCHSIKKQPTTSDVTQNIDDETCSDESCGEMDPVDWATEEKSVFMQSFSSYGKDFAKISRRVGTKSRDQCKVFFSKIQKSLGTDLTRLGNLGTPSDYGNGGGSDAEDACVVETSSVISSDKLGSKMDDDLLLTIKNSDQVATAVPDRNMNLQTDLKTSEEENDMEKDSKDSEVAGTVISKSCEIVGPTLVVKHEIPKDADKECDLVHARNSAAELASAEAGKGQGTAVTDEAVTHESSNSAAVAENKALGEITADGFENSFSDRQVSTEVRLNVQASENASPLETSPHSELSHDTERQHQVSTEKSCIMLLPQENNLASTNFGLQDSGPIPREKKLHEDRLLSANLDHQEGRLKTVRDDYHLLVQGSNLSNQMESSHILSGYPLRIPTKEMNGGDICCRQQPSEVQSHSKSNQYWDHLQKCSSTKACELPMHSEKSSVHHHQPRVRARSLSDTEKPSRNGDVKLFGKILSKSSSSHNPDDNNQGSSRSSSTLEFSGHHHPSVDRNNYLGLERSRHGLWDGNRRIQTMPDSALLLAKYPAAFSNHPVGPSTLVKNDDHHSCTLNGVSVSPPVSNVGMMDYEIYRSREVAMKQQPQDVFVRSVGFDAIVSLQQRMVVGRGGVVVGGACTAVSDPVAAIKMHYAKAEQQYGGGGGQAMPMREDGGPWGAAGR